MVRLRGCVVSCCGGGCQPSWRRQQQQQWQRQQHKHFSAVATNRTLHLQTTRTRQSERTGVDVLGSNEETRNLNMQFRISCTQKQQPPNHMCLALGYELFRSPYLSNHLSLHSTLHSRRSSTGVGSGVSGNDWSGT